MNNSDNRLSFPLKTGPLFLEAEGGWVGLSYRRKVVTGGSVGAELALMKRVLDTCGRNAWR